MQKIIIAIFLTLAASILVSAQKVEVDQAFIDAANQSFKEVAALRQTVLAKNETISAKNDAIDSKNLAIKAKDALIAQKQKRIDELIAIKCNETTISFKPLGWSIIKRTKKTCF